MNHVPAFAEAGPPDRPPLVTWPHVPANAGPRPAAAWRSTDPVRSMPCSDRQFIDLLASYRAHGGLARAAEVLEMFDLAHRGELSRLARQIVDRQVISVDWHQETWLPLFQFDRPDMRVRHLLAPVLTELIAAYDPLELAQWFVRPNSALGGLRPAAALTGSHQPACEVLQAARTDRFVLHG